MHTVAFKYTFIYHKVVNHNRMVHRQTERNEALQRFGFMCPLTASFVE